MANEGGDSVHLDVVLAALPESQIASHKLQRPRRNKLKLELQRQRAFQKSPMLGATAPLEVRAILLTQEMSCGLAAAKASRAAR